MVYNEDPPHRPDPPPLPRGPVHNRYKVEMLLHVPFVVVEGVLCSVAMVNIPINDENAK